VLPGEMGEIRDFEEHKELNLDDVMKEVLGQGDGEGFEIPKVRWKSVEGRRGGWRSVRVVGKYVERG
jgi:hypothetical protein